MQSLISCFLIHTTELSIKSLMWNSLRHLRRSNLSWRWLRNIRASRSQRFLPTERMSRLARLTTAPTRSHGEFFPTAKLCSQASSNSRASKHGAQKHLESGPTSGERSMNPKASHAKSSMTFQAHTTSSPLLTTTLFREMSSESSQTSSNKPKPTNSYLVT